MKLNQTGRKKMFSLSHPNSDSHHPKFTNGTGINKRNKENSEEKNGNDFNLATFEFKPLYINFGLT